MVPAEAYSPGKADLLEAENSLEVDIYGLQTKPHKGV